jgi:hypothetical protein
MLLETVFEYRTLIGKCDLGCGLEWHEIDEMDRIEHTFRSNRGDGRRRFRRQTVDMTAIMRGDQINDRVTIVEMGPGGAICVFSPYIARNEPVEIVIDEGEYSYRFRAKGVWLRDAGEDYRVGLQFVGMPVRLHKVQISEHNFDVVDKIVTAAA